MTKGIQIVVIGLMILITEVVTADSKDHSLLSPAPKPVTATTQAAQPVRRIQPPVVAGMFYPGDAKALSEQVREFIAQARVEKIGKVRGLVCPHAGYRYSGPVAAFAYKLLEGRDVATVVLLGPSHHSAFRGISVCQAEGMATPLGLVEVSPKTRQIVNEFPFIPNPPKDVLAGDDDPYAAEHSLEVQLPFLQTVLKKFTVIPAVFGRPGSEADAARTLATIVDDRTLIVASSDLSHYHPYDVAKEKDRRCVQAICDLNVEAMRDQEACGKSPVLTLMHLARQKGWKAKLLDLRNSGDTAGDRSRVVGYAAIAFYEPNAPVTENKQLTQAERRFLLDLARKALTEAAGKGSLAAMKDETVPARLKAKSGCFVTLTKNGVLRGCIGHIFPRESLFQAVRDNALNAALMDPRFSPVTTGELGQIQIEVSVLTVPEPLAFTSPEDLLRKLVPGRDGVVLICGPAQSTFLPQVWEQLGDKEEFMNHLARKAGLSPSAWRDSDTRILIYHVTAFKESEK